MDISLYETEAGAGAPLVLLHGNGESAAYFARQFPAFSTCFHVIAVDTRGHGQSPRGAAPFTISQFAEDLYAFFEQKGIEKAHILGFSDGGNIALTFALRHPERVNRLILNGANLDPSGVKPLIQLPIELGYRLLLPFAARSGKAKSRMELLSLMVNQPRIDPKALSTLSVRTLVLVGTRDMIRDAHSKKIAGSLPDAKLVRIPGGHFIAAENPDAYNAAVLGFLLAP